MRYSTDVLRIIEAGLNGDTEQVKRRARALADKMHKGDHMKRAIMKRLEVNNKTEPVLTVFPK